MLWLLSSISLCVVINSCISDLYSHMWKPFQDSVPKLSNMSYETSSQLHVECLTLLKLLPLVCLLSLFLWVSECMCACLCACLHAYTRMHTHAVIQLSHWSLWLMHTRHSDSRKVHWNRLCLSPHHFCVCMCVSVGCAIPSIWPLISQGKDCLCIWSLSAFNKFTI